ncbi:MAG: hypothetical protein GY804_15570, partial [Alphaproteobacteria bacterium]|nr:hypothetical protein [Alphaproteobacteria bacterium]
TTKYIWHTQKDSKTRSSHADRDGKVFEWAHPPEGGHPGEDYNCRCWAEPIFDDMARGKKCEELACNLKSLRKEKREAIEEIQELEVKIVELKAFVEANSYANVTHGLSDIGQNVPENIAAGCGTGGSRGGRAAGLPGAAAGCAAGALGEVVQGVAVDSVKAIKEAIARRNEALRQISSCEGRVATLKQDIEYCDKQIDDHIKVQDEYGCKWYDKCPSK